MAREEALTEIFVHVHPGRRQMSAEWVPVVVPIRRPQRPRRAREARPTRIQRAVVDLDTRADRHPRARSCTGPSAKLGRRPARGDGGGSAVGLDLKLANDHPFGPVAPLVSAGVVDRAEAGGGDGRLE